MTAGYVRTGSGGRLSFTWLSQRENISHSLPVTFLKNKTLANCFWFLDTLGLQGSSGLDRILVHQLILSVTERV